MGLDWNACLSVLWTIGVVVHGIQIGFTWPIQYLTAVKGFANSTVVEVTDQAIVNTPPARGPFVRYGSIASSGNLNTEDSRRNLP